MDRAKNIDNVDSRIKVLIHDIDKLLSEIDPITATIRSKFKSLISKKVNTDGKKIGIDRHNNELILSLNFDRGTQESISVRDRDYEKAAEPAYINFYRDHRDPGENGFVGFTFGANNYEEGIAYADAYESTEFGWIKRDISSQIDTDKMLTLCEEFRDILKELVSDKAK